MTVPVDELRQAIVRAGSIDGVLRFGGTYSNWPDVDQWKALPSEAGLYAIGFKLGVKYDLAASRIVYVGSTLDLRSRVRTHDNRSHNSDLEFLKQLYPRGLLVTFHALPGLSAQWLSALEDATLQEARRTFGAYPICNRARIDSPHVECCAGLVRIVPCEGLPAARSVAKLGNELGSKTLGQLVDPKPAEPWKDKSRCSGAGIVFTSEPQPTIPIAERPATEVDPEFLSWIIAEHIALWNLEKMRQVIRICASLSPVPKKGKSKVQTFAASNRETPCPHTWGEVAIVQGRIHSETWTPAERLWIKIEHEKELLGQAIFDNGIIDGRDKSDLPQTRERPSFYDCVANCEEANAIQGELPHDFVPPPDETDSLPLLKADPRYSEELRLLAVRHEQDVAFARFKAIDQDKYRRIREALYEKMEANFRHATTETEQ